MASKVGIQIVLLATLLDEIPKELTESLLKIKIQSDVTFQLVSLTKSQLVNLHNPDETVDLSRNLAYPFSTAN